MSIYPDLNAWHEEFTALRRDLHAHPEIAFEEVRTSDVIAAKLKEIGVDVISRDWTRSKTGIVATIHGKTGAANDPDRAIALRADIDALPIFEETGLPYASKIPGRMHACGHDGHAAILLLAAKYLATHRNFSGSVHLLFQPAEEVTISGAEDMVKEGLFDKHPVKSVWGMHNDPSLPLGKVAYCIGPSSAAVDNIIIKVEGHGGHAAYPSLTIDPIVMASHLIVALQTVVSRSIDPIKEAVVSITYFQGGNGAHNVIPGHVELRGTVRTYHDQVRKKVHAHIASIADGIGTAFGGKIDITTMYGSPAVINTEAETLLAKSVMVDMVGEKNVRVNPPSMGGEDFSFFLQKNPGSYIRVGTAKTDKDPSLHDPAFDFNDASLPIAAMYWVKLVEKSLPV